MPRREQGARHRTPLGAPGSGRCVLQSEHGRGAARGDRAARARRRRARRRAAPTGCTSVGGRARPWPRRPSRRWSRGLPRERPAGLRAAAAQRLVDDHRRRADPAGRAGRGLPRAAAPPGVVLRLPRRRPRGRHRRLRAPRRSAAGRAVDLPPGHRRHPRPAPLLAPPARRCPGWSPCARPGRRRGSGAGTTTCSPPPSPTRPIAAAADARRRAARRARAVAGAGRGHASSTSGRRCGPGGSPKAYVDAGHVRSWRLLLDAHVGRAAGRSAGRRRMTS